MQKAFVALLLVVGGYCAQAQPPKKSTLKLWYNQPSGTVWENALPVGNGFIAGMVYGNVAQENIQLNEATVWTGSPNRNDNPDALASLPAIRKLIFEGKQKEAEKLAESTIQSKKSNGQMYQPVGNLMIRFDNHTDVSNYSRELDIAQAIATTQYTVNGVRYVREVFTSHKDNVMVVRLSADKAKQLRFSAFFQSPQRNKQIRVTANKQLILQGSTGGHETVEGGKLRFYSVVQVASTDGTLSQTDTSLVLNDATQATLLLTIASNFVNYNDLSGNEVQKATLQLQKGLSKPFAQLKTEHISAFQRYFNRVSLDLGDSEQRLKPTNQRLKEFATTNDPQLVSLYFQYGRYLLISSSQPSGQPANLQGIWNHKMNPPWDSKYTININTEMNYWPAEKDNLSEMHEPLIKMVQELAVTGQQTAKDMYGARGWLAHHNTDLWRITGPVDRIFWGIWSMGGAWLSQHLWERYLYVGDKQFLASVYPIFKGSSQFFKDYLVEHPQYKWLVINPGTSPENAPNAHQGSSFDAGTTMDTQIVDDIFSVTIKSAELLGIKDSFIDSLKTYRQRLAPMHIGKHGQLQEWLEDIDDPNDHHRHISHLYGLFPSSQISPYRTPELFSAARTTLLHRGDISTGWSMGWKVNWWARMLDGNHAYQLIQNQLSPLGTTKDGGGTYDNLFDAHPPFQIDGNFGCTSGITEMLLQSYDGNIHLLPALPDGWQSGTLKGVKARGGFEIVEMAWTHGKLTKLIVKSNLGGNCRIRANAPIKHPLLQTAKGENRNPFYYTEQPLTPIISSTSKVTVSSLPETYLYDFNTQKGKTYVILP
ncbi:MAG: glycoside hydrolase family 95 protein [Spirosomataceae bacterium]